MFHFSGLGIGAAIAIIFDAGWDNKSPRCLLEFI